MIDRSDVIRVLQDVVDAKSIKAVAVQENSVRITLSASEEDSHNEQLRLAIQAAVTELPGIERADVFYIVEGPAADEEQEQHEHGHDHDHGHEHGHGPQGHGQPPAKIELPGVKHIIAVGAGKGGVGKSTLAVHLAVGLRRLGHSVGLLDADVYGPSIAAMTGIEGLPAIEGSKDHTIAPYEAMGLKVVSMANFIDPDAPLIWRGPMIHSAIRQLLTDVEWGDLDYLVVDLPPGTGDVPLTLAQSVNVDGAVVVSTPQDVAMNDAIRAMRMYEALGIHVLGLVENMSYFVCDKCNAEHDIFGRGGVKRAADALGAAFLGEIPMTSQLRRNTDNADADASFDADGPVARAMEAIVRNVAGKIETAG